MKMMVLIALAERHGIATVFDALQLAAKTTDHKEMEELRRECRNLNLRDTDTLAVVREKLIARAKGNR
jgi:hypothetical protein